MSTARRRVFGAVGAHSAPRKRHPAVKFMREFGLVVRTLEWIEVCYLLYFVGAGIVAGMVYEAIRDHIR